jgi:hypothetical protein
VTPARAPRAADLMHVTDRGPLRHSDHLLALPAPDSDDDFDVLPGWPKSTPDGLEGGAFQAAAGSRFRVTLGASDETMSTRNLGSIL